MDDARITIPTEYSPFLEDLKERIRSAQVRAVVSVNRELVLLYWNIGKRILAAQGEQGWGTRVVQKLSADLSEAFPEMKGFSPRNLDYMLAFAKAWPEEAILQQLAAKLPWFHNCLILDKLKTSQHRLWYMEQSLANGWSRNILALQIKSKLHERQGAAPTNFPATLPAPQSDLAANLLKDPYNFDFLSLGKEAHEREIEGALIDHIRKFLLELGVGFAFVANQHRLAVADEEFFIDLLFYHVRLHCYVVIELKAGPFKPEYAGKLNFYLSAVDDLLRTDGDAPSIGLILCQEKNRVLAEYALRDMNKPIGVSSYELTSSLPDEIRTVLPTVEELEQELSDPGDREVASENLQGQHSPTGPAPRPADAAEYAVSISDRCVELWSTERLPFEPKGSLVKMRAELRTALAALQGSREEILHAIYVSDVHRYRCDTENILLYNVGAAAFQTSMRRGLRFERHFARPVENPTVSSAAHYHRYTLVPVSGSFQGWVEKQSLATWDNVQLLDPSRLETVWAAMHETPASATSSLASGDFLGVTLRLGVPANGRKALPGLVKPLLDGIVCGFHRHVGPLDQVVKPISARLELEPELVTRWLTSSSQAVLGDCSLVACWNNGVKWNPQDDLCVAVEIITHPTSGDHWRLAGKLYTVIPSPLTTTK